MHQDYKESTKRRYVWGGRMTNQEQYEETLRKAEAFDSVLGEYITFIKYHEDHWLFAIGVMSICERYREKTNE